MRPCKTCNHVQDHEIASGGSGDTCSKVKCKCIWYESMDNLEYLEWLDKQHEKASSRI